MSFQPCLECRRHVRAGDGLCPFCGAVAPAPRASASPTTRLTRGALFAFATTVAACGGTETPETTTDTGAVSDGTADGVADTGTKDDGIDTGDTGGPVAAYGGPPDTGLKPDTATDTAPDVGDAATDGTATDSGGGTPLYGSPPPF